MKLFLHTVYIYIYGERERERERAREKKTASSVVSSLSLLCLAFLQSRCNSLAFRTSVLLRLLLDLDTYAGVDPLGVFSLFLKKGTDIIAPKLCIIFRNIRLGSFPECWRSANVTAIPNGASSPEREIYTDPYQ